MKKNSHDPFTGGVLHAGSSRTAIAIFQREDGDPQGPAAPAPVRLHQEPGPDMKRWQLVVRQAAGSWTFWLPSHGVPWRSALTRALSAMGACVWRGERPGEE